MTEKIKKSDLWYTPQWLIDTARSYLGGEIELDPASDEQANKRVGAKTIIAENSLSVEWPSVKTLFMNPPFSQAKKFYEKVVRQHHAGKASDFFMVLPGNINSAYLHHAIEYYRVFAPKQRVAFVSPESDSVKTSPRGNIVFVANRVCPIPVKGLWLTSVDPWTGGY